jgi:hypothetical protein
VYDLLENYSVDEIRSLISDVFETGISHCTGIIEGACRYLIKDRMVTGARWRIKGAEAVLKLRSLKASGDCTDYWRFHEQQEFQRNHSSKYNRPSVINKLHVKSV